MTQWISTLVVGTCWLFTIFPGKTQATVDIDDRARATRKGFVVMEFDRKAFSLSFDRGTNVWLDGRPAKSGTGLTSAQARQAVLQHSPSDFVVDFQTAGLRDAARKNSMLSRLKKILTDTPYEIDGGWENKVVGGHVFPQHFTIRVVRSA